MNPKPVLFVESPRAPLEPGPVITLEKSKAISRSKGYEDALRSLVTSAAAVLIVAFTTIPSEKLAEFTNQLGLSGFAGIAVLALLRGLQRYFENRAKHPPNSEVDR